MAISQLLAISMFMAVGADPIDRAHGAKPTTTKTAPAEQSDTWTRWKSQLFGAKTARPPEPARSTRSSRVMNRPKNPDAAKTDSSKSFVRSLRTLLPGTTEHPSQRRARPAPSKPTVLGALRDKLAELRAWRTGTSTKATASVALDNAERPDRIAVPDSEQDFATVSIHKNVPVAPASELDSPAGWAPADSIATAGADLPVADQVSTVTVRTPDVASDTTGRLPVDLPADASAEATGSNIAAVPADGAMGNLVRESDPTEKPDSVVTAELSEAAAADANAAELPSGRTPGDTAVEHAIDFRSSTLDPSRNADSGSGLIPAFDAPPALAGDPSKHGAVKRTDYIRSLPAAADARSAGPAAATATHNRLLGSLFSPAVADALSGLPAECYPVGALFLVSGLVWVLARGGRANEPRLPYVVAAPAGVSHPMSWPVSLSSGANLTGQPVSAARGCVMGALTATIGAAIVAVGATSALRAQLADQPALFRPGVLIAAVGQVILLFGIVAMALRGMQRRRTEHELQLAQLPVSASPIHHGAGGFAVAHWPVPSPVSASSGTTTGQIAQLKAQLACLSQQLDHLGTGESAAPTAASSK